MFAQYKKKDALHCSIGIANDSGGGAIRPTVHSQQEKVRSDASGNHKQLQLMDSSRKIKNSEGEAAERRGETAAAETTLSSSRGDSSSRGAEGQ